MAGGLDLGTLFGAIELEDRYSPALHSINEKTVKALDGITQLDTVLKTVGETALRSGANFKQFADAHAQLAVAKAQVNDYKNKLDEAAEAVRKLGAAVPDKLTANVQEASRKFLEAQMNADKLAAALRDVEKNAASAGAAVAKAATSSAEGGSSKAAQNIADAQQRLFVQQSKGAQESANAVKQAAESSAAAAIKAADRATAAAVASAAKQVAETAKIAAAADKAAAAAEKAADKAAAAAEKSAAKQVAAADKIAVAAEKAADKAAAAAEKVAAKQVAATEKAAAASKQAAQEEADRIQKIGTALTDLGRGATSVGMILTAAVTVPLVAGGTAAVTFATEFEKDMTRVNTLSGITKEALAGMKQEVLELAPSLGATPAEAAKALLAVTSTGIKGAEAIDLMKISLQNTAIGMGDATDNARLLTSIVKAYGESNMTAGHAAEIMFRIVRDGNADAVDLASSLGRVVGVAATLGVSLEDVGTFIASYTRIGVKTSEAVTAVRGLIQNLDLKRATQPAKDALASVGLTIEGLRKSIKESGLTAAMQDLFIRFHGHEEDMQPLIANIRAMAGAMGTYGAQTEDVIKIQAAMMKGGDTERMAAFATVTETMAFKWDALKSEFIKVAISLGNTLIPILEQLMELCKDVVIPFIQTVVDVFASLPTPVQEAALGLAAVAIIAGPSLIFIGQLIVSIGYLRKAYELLAGVSSIPGLLKILGFGVAEAAAQTAVVAGASTAATVVAGGGTAAAMVGGSAAAAGGAATVATITAVQGASVAAATATTAAATTAATTLGLTALAWTGVGLAVIAAAGGAYLLYENWDKVTGTSKESGDAIKAVGDLTLDPLKGDVNAVKDSLQNKLESPWEADLTKITEIKIDPLAKAIDDVKVKIESPLTLSWYESIKAELARLKTLMKGELPPLTPEDHAKFAKKDFIDEYGRKIDTSGGLPLPPIAPSLLDLKFAIGHGSDSGPQDPRYNEVTTGGINPWGETWGRAPTSARASTAAFPMPQSIADINGMPGTAAQAQQNLERFGNVQPSNLVPNIQGDENKFLSADLEKTTQLTGKAKKAAQDYVAVWKELNSLGGSYMETLDSLTPKQIAILDGYLQQGVSVEKLAAAFPKLTKSQVDAVKATMDYRDALGELTFEQRASIAADIDRGKTVAEIAKVKGWDPSLVAAFGKELKAVDEEATKYNAVAKDFSTIGQDNFATLQNVNSERVKEIDHLLNAGKSVHDIGTFYKDTSKSEIEAIAATKGYRNATVELTDAQAAAIKTAVDQGSSLTDVISAFSLNKEAAAQYVEALKTTKSAQEDYDKLLEHGVQGQLDANERLRADALKKLPLTGLSGPALAAQIAAIGAVNQKYNLLGDNVKGVITNIEVTMEHLGVYSQASLTQTAVIAKDRYQKMLVSGKYTAVELEKAYKTSAEAQSAAIGLSTDLSIGAYKTLAEKAKKTYDEMVKNGITGINALETQRSEIYNLRLSGAATPEEKIDIVNGKDVDDARRNFEAIKNAGSSSATEIIEANKKMWELDHKQGHDAATIIVGLFGGISTALDTIASSSDTTWSRVVKGISGAFKIADAFQKAMELTSQGIAGTGGTGPGGKKEIASVVPGAAAGAAAAVGGSSAALSTVAAATAASVVLAWVAVGIAVFSLIVALKQAKEESEKLRAAEQARMKLAVEFMAGTNFSEGLASTIHDSTEDFAHITALNTKYAMDLEWITFIGSKLSTMTDEQAASYDNGTEQLKLYREMMKGAGDDTQIFLRDLGEAAHLSDIIKELGGVSKLSGDQLARVQKLTKDLFVLIALGGSIGTDALKSMDTTLMSFVENLASKGGLVNKFFLDMAASAKAAGVELAEVSKFQASEAKAAGEGIVGALHVPGEARTKREDLSTKLGEDLDKLDSTGARNLSRVLELQEKIKGATAADAQKYSDEIDAIIKKDGDRIKSILDTNKEMETQQKIIDATGIHSTAAAGAVSSSLLGIISSQVAAGTSYGDAIRAIAPGIADLKVQLDELGIGGGPVFDFLNQQVALFTDEVAGPALTSIEAYTNGLVGLHNSGQLTQETFAGITEQIGKTADTLVAQGVSGHGLLVAMQSPLQKIWELEKNFGYEADSTTQALVDQALADGEIGEKHMSVSDQMLAGTNKMVDAITYLATVFGYIPPAVEEVGKSIATLPDVTKTATDETKKSLDGLAADFVIEPGVAMDPGDMDKVKNQLDAAAADFVIEPAVTMDPGDIDKLKTTIDDVSADMVIEPAIVIDSTDLDVVKSKLDIQKEGFLALGDTSETIFGEIGGNVKSLNDPLDGIKKKFTDDIPTGIRTAAAVMHTSAEAMVADLKKIEDAATGAAEGHSPTGIQQIRTRINELAPASTAAIRLVVGNFGTLEHVADETADHVKALADATKKVNDTVSDFYGAEGVLSNATQEQRDFMKTALDAGASVSDLALMLDTTEASVSLYAKQLSDAAAETKKFEDAQKSAIQSLKDLIATNKTADLASAASAAIAKLGKQDITGALLASQTSLHAAQRAAAEKDLQDQLDIANEVLQSVQNGNSVKADALDVQLGLMKKMHDLKAGYEKEDTITAFNTEVKGLGMIPAEYARTYGDATKAIRDQYADQLTNFRAQRSSEIALLGPVPNAYNATYQAAVNAVNDKFAILADRARESTATQLDQLGEIPSVYESTYTEAFGLVTDKYKDLLEKLGVTPDLPTMQNFADQYETMYAKSFANIAARHTELLSSLGSTGLGAVGGSGNGSGSGIYALHPGTGSTEAEWAISRTLAGIWDQGDEQRYLASFAATGGVVTQTGLDPFQPKGTDTEPFMLSPGETVLTPQQMQDVQDNRSSEAPSNQEVVEAINGLRSDLASKLPRALARTMETALVGLRTAS
jgi:hypothetical protein